MMQDNEGRPDGRLPFHRNEAAILRLRPLGYNLNNVKLRVDCLQGLITRQLCLREMRKISRKTINGQIRFREKIFRFASK